MEAWKKERVTRWWRIGILVLKGWGTRGGGMGMRTDLRVDGRRSTVHRNLWARPASIVFVLHRRENENENYNKKWFSRQSTNQVCRSPFFFFLFNKTYLHLFFFFMEKHMCIYLCVFLIQKLISCHFYKRQRSNKNWCISSTL